MADQFPMDPNADKKPGTALVPFRAASTAVVRFDQSRNNDDDGIVLDGEFIRMDRPRLAGPHAKSRAHAHGYGRFNDPDEDEADHKERASFLRAAHAKHDDDAAKDEDFIVSGNDPSQKSDVNADSPLGLPGSKSDAHKSGVRKIRCADGRYIYDHGHELRAREGKISPAQAAMMAKLSGEKGWQKLYVYHGNGKKIHAEAASMINATAHSAGLAFNIVMDPKIAGRIGSHKRDALKAIDIMAKAAETFTTPSA